ncbi:c-di-GMP-binding flagellar brake protein YcgR, contains PilZNR and PilZ domains [Psychrobacillus sp. OK028]|uniref:flagellar brake protein n=1 Tax=Psychrobacillus sp. OK028 TaxID=1884359 RepID=UPI00088E1B4D|nr:flagellar brake domain-containing protein [Psychrobacillus sp. OK028]SDN00728.1 c-di-GMP-binding flagellar brake protein YcgR, contains PilZNR and PilZ domains [Psychrobacillus sp. OK028]
MKIKLGTQLTLEPTFTDKTEKYRCKVVDLDNQFIYIDYPMDTLSNRTVFLMDGMQLRATFVEESKAVYAFQTEVLGKISKQIPVVKLALPAASEFLRIQRRDFVRVSTSVDISVQFEEERYQFVTDDISAGGTAVILNKEVNFKAGDEVTLLIPLLFNNGDIKYVTTLAQVIRIFEKGSLTIASLQFTDTDDLDKQQIVRFCFERQLLIRKKTLS